MKKFGTINGVFIPSYEAILGAVLFLILPFLVTVMGLRDMVLIVIMANTVTLATAFSISDCATNLKTIGGGGMYAIAKRSLGKAFGGSIGIQLFLAQAVSIGFYCIAFATPLQSLIAGIPGIGAFVEARGWSILVQQQILATFIALIAFIAGIVGADFIVKIQTIIFVVLTAAIITIILSPLFGLETASSPLFTASLNWTGFGPRIGFWAAFAAFFPAVTGIDAGVGMSGSLKEPRKSLPQGTFLAIAITFVLYLFITGVYALLPSDAPSSVIDIYRGILIIPQLLLLGILFATGSSALSYFMTAPRTAQALALDDILPKGLAFLGKDWKKGGVEPRYATILTFVIVVPVIWAGDVTFASTVVGICFLVVYGWINLAAFFERISGNPSFRPTSRGHWAISLYGFALCMIVIGLFNIWIGLGVVVSQLVIFLLLLRYKSNNRIEGVWWGLVFRNVSRGLRQMGRIIQGSKNWRPIMGIFCFADSPRETGGALRMANRISEFQGLSMINFIANGEPGEVSTLDPTGNASLIRVPDKEYNAAVLAAVQADLPGSLVMNTVFLTLDSRLRITMLTERLLEIGKNIILYKSGLIPLEEANRIDVWWKGAENGNLMALLSYIIRESDRRNNRRRQQIRLIRKLSEGEDRLKGREEMEQLMEGARLDGEVLILENDQEKFPETIRRYSADASLILMGMPGKRPGNLARLFSLDKYFFSEEIHKYESLPPLLFVKAASVVNLLE